MPSLSSLLKDSTPDAEEVVKACNAALKEDKTNTEAQHAKIVALLNLDRYGDAIKMFNDLGDGMKKKAAIEYAYALYRSEQLEKAREIANGHSDKAARHLEAQASYRLEDFANTVNIYRELWADASADEETDLRLNLGAADAQLLWARKSDQASKKRPGKEDLETFEAAYNAACGCIARGELSQGEFLLKRAKDLCLSSETLTENEKKDELLPITVQQLFVLASSGKIEQAESLAKDISISDAITATNMIARMNQLISPTDQANPYLSSRILSSHFHNDQMFSFQQSILNQNITTHDLMGLKFNGVISSTARLLAQDPSPTLSPSTNAASSANAAGHAQNQLGKIGLKSILPLLEKRPKDVGLLATIIQIYVLTHNFGAAVTVLEAFFKRLEESNSETDQDVRHAPGLIAIAVSLYSREGKKSHVQTELSKAASYWRRKSKCPPELLRVAGLSLLSSGDKESLEEAGKVFDTLHQQDKSDRFASAGLVAAYAQSNFSKVKAEAEKLTPINRLTAGIDVDALENLGVPQSADATSAIINRKRAAAGASKPSKKRKSKLPKDYNPDKKPDPERWLPLRDRSSYRPKGKKGKQKQAALTQGGIEKDQPAEAPKPPPVAGGGAGKSKKKKNKK